MDANEILPPAGVDVLRPLDRKVHVRDVAGTCCDVGSSECVSLFNCLLQLY